MQLVTGHRNFGEYLQRFKLNEREFECMCGVNEESVIHVRDECKENVRRAAREKGMKEWKKAGHELPTPYEGKKEKRKLTLKIINSMGEIMIKNEEINIEEAGVLQCVKM